MRKEDAKIRFARYIEQDSVLGCWNWTGALRRGGGQFGISQGKVLSAHRAAWVLFKGEVPPGQYVVRTCMNTLCVNPAHHKLSPVVSKRKRSPMGDLMLKVQRNASTGCWEFLSSKTPGGYGRLLVGGQSLMAHRVSWELFNGMSAGDKMVCHKCDNPCCVNPDHLFLGTAFDNTSDSISKQRRKIASIETDTVGFRLREMRTSCNLSLGALGQRLGVSRQCIQQWEKGDSIPNDTTVRRLADALGATPQELLGGYRQYDTHVAGRGARITRDARNALSEYSQRVGVSESEALLMLIATATSSEEQL